MIVLGTVIDHNSAQYSTAIQSYSGKLVIANSTISHHQFGLGVIGATGQVTITNSTISENSVEESEFMWLNGAYLDHVTIADNTTERGNSTYINGDDITFHNSILAGGGNLLCGSGTGPITSAGYNLVDVADGCNWVPGPGDLLGTAAAPIDPMLGPLADNGGPTLTNALLPGSPAIDTGAPHACLPVDQRGVLRPQGAGCDIGAYEYGPLAVSIDIRPGTSDNVINRKSRTTAPVAILSTAGFDAGTEVDRESLTFGRTGDEQSLARKKLVGEPLCEMVDVNGDGLLDLVCSFRIPKMDFRCGDPAGVLKGRTTEGVGFSGVDLVKIIPCR
jgi:hypothetical protein